MKVYTITIRKCSGQKEMKQVETTLNTYRHLIGQLEVKYKTKIWYKFEYTMKDKIANVHLHGVVIVNDGQIVYLESPKSYSVKIELCVSTKWIRYMNKDGYSDDTLDVNHMKMCLDFAWDPLRFQELVPDEPQDI